MYKIKIEYSWGDSEPVISGIETLEEAWEKAEELMLEEARIVVFENGESCSLDTDDDAMQGILHYHSDSSYCFYSIVEYE